MQENSLELAQVVLRQGELRLQAQLQIALAADQRAITAAAMLVATSAVVLGAFAHWLDSSAVDPDVAYGALICGLVLVVAAGLCASAASPTKFDLAGANPGNWWDDGVDCRPLVECLTKESLNYHARIARNRDLLSKNAKRLKWGLRAALIAPFSGLLWAAPHLYLGV